MIFFIPSVLFILLICSVLVIMKYHFTNKMLRTQNINLLATEKLYYSNILEKAKIEERYEQLKIVELQYNELRALHTNLEKENVKLLSNLQQEKINVQEKIQLLEYAEKKLTDSFHALSANALSQNNQSFLDLAKTVFEKMQENAKNEINNEKKSVESIVDPIKIALTGVHDKLQDLEKSRIGAYESLRQQVGDLINSQNLLKNETNNLVSALRSPSTRGRWGEMQLRRVVELAGMVEHCDFDEQVSISSESGTKIRPDMIIHIPGNRNIVIDAKAPLSAYLDALETNNDRKSLLKEHAKQIREHIKLLANKRYWEEFQPGPEFVVLFLPSDIFLSSALEVDPGIMEYAMQERIMLSTPMNLLALLHSVALGWRQESLAENAKHIIKMGQELYKRLSDLSKHFEKLGNSLNSAITNYNATVSSLEKRVFVTARKFKELESHEKDIVEIEQIEKTCIEPKNAA